jgi:hypothetical protein
MNTSLTAALVIAGLAAAACASDNDTLLIPNSHGGYNVIQQGGQRGSIPLFGPHGFAAHMREQARVDANEKPKFIIYPVVEDDGHGNKHTVYKKVKFATAEEAEAAKAAMH